MLGMMGSAFGGIRIVSSPLIPRFRMVQFRFPRTKSKRIRKKWAKRNENFRQEPIREAYVIGGNTMVLHPDGYNKMVLGM